MSKSQFDADQYKIGQRKGWDTVAAGWQKWWKTLEKGKQGVSDKLVKLAEIKPGQRVLDIATGIGEPAITAARAFFGNQTLGQTECHGSIICPFARIQIEVSATSHT